MDEASAAYGPKLRRVAADRPGGSGADAQPRDGAQDRDGGAQRSQQAGAWSGTTFNQTPKEFCPECQKIVRKLDLDPRHLGGFQKSVMDF